ncbi:Asp23/Gls24 family envelope stress response protein [Tepidibacillus fermentans]|uniref:Putative alkaline shock family protein YloU n=1 Tax=Tepidibacillus fermentans TaxID=1281767 RepID=A0A4R3KJU5_9BACI|nr:Asp23/Gls24 family envelope stress response protein [Tepidibacillus fermentans]TCS84033.1 putative alkaline shock family protein YloU [Tepidibacillus fermentans]
MDTRIRYDEENKLGTIQISPQVIEMIAKLTAEEVEGVFRLSGGRAREFVDFLGRNKANTRGVRSQVGQREVAVDISIIIEYGQPFLTVAETLQEQIKNAIEGMTDLSVVEINVHIDDIHYDDK